MTTKQIENSFQEIWQLFRDTDRKFQETDRKFQDTDRKFQETDRKLSILSESTAALSSKWGRFVEGLIVPAVERLFEERNINVDKVYQRVKTHQNAQTMEIDILAINGDNVILIEAKSTLSVEDVKEHLDRLANFKTFFPEYQNRKVNGAVAGIVLDEGIDRYAYKQGLFVIGESGKTVKILNDEKFIPQNW